MQIDAPDNTGAVFSYKLRYIVGFWLVEMAISTNQKPTIYRNLYENSGPDKEPQVSYLANPKHRINAGTTSKTLARRWCSVWPPWLQVGKDTSKQRVWLQSAL